VKKRSVQKTGNEIVQIWNEETTGTDSVWGKAGSQGGWGPKKQGLGGQRESQWKRGGSQRNSFQPNLQDPAKLRRKNPKRKQKKKKTPGVGGGGGGGGGGTPGGGGYEGGRVREGAQVCNSMCGLDVIRDLLGRGENETDVEGRETIRHFLITD